MPHSAYNNLPAPFDAEWADELDLFKENGLDAEVPQYQFPLQVPMKEVQKQEQKEDVHEELFENNLMFQSTMVKESEQKSPSLHSGANFKTTAYRSDEDFDNFEDIEEIEIVVPNFDNISEPKESQNFKTEASKSEQSQETQALKKEDFTSGNSKVVRKDVINKTVIRALKRHFTQIFSAENPEFALVGKKAQAEEFMPKTQELAGNLFVPEALPTGVTIESIASVLRMLISTETAKFCNKSRAERNLAKDFNDVIYKYSHKRLFKLAKDTTFSYLFVNFVLGGEFATLVEQDATMGLNPEAYLTASEALAKVFN
jgi:hypothetical protein